MSVNLSIKNVPKDLATRLRQQATANHRSLQGELMSIVENAVPERKMSIEEVWAGVQAIGFRSPNESTRMIREDRDSDHGRDPLP